MALAYGVRMRLTATLNSLIIAGVISWTSTPRVVERAFCRLPRWSMAVPAMMPRSSESAFMRFSLPGDSVTGIYYGMRVAEAACSILQPHRLVVACHLQIAGAARRPAVSNRAFPVARTRRVLRHQFLIVHRRRAFQCNAQRGDSDPPPYGIAAAGLPTGPIIERLELEIRPLQVRGAPVGSDVGSRRPNIYTSIGVAQLKQHQLRAGIKLDAEPVPSLLLRFHLMGEPFVIHPGRSRDLGAVQCTSHVQAWEGDVVRRLAGARRLLADAVLAVDHRRRARREAQREANVLGHRAECLGAGRRVPFRLPIAVPDARLRCARTRDSRARPV